MTSARHVQNKTLTTDIERLAGDGGGLAHHNGKVLIVPGALPGERIEYSVRREKRHQVDGRLQAVLTPSPLRVAPRCPHYAQCGGCQLQHLDVVAQLAEKQALAVATLRRIGHVEPARVLAPISGQPWGYRRRARLGVKYLPKTGRMAVGFRQEGSSQLTLLARCEVLVPAIGEHIDALAAMLGKLEIRERIPQIEVAAGDNAAALVLRVLEPPGAADRDRLLAFGREYDLQIHLQPGGPNTVAPLAGAAAPLYYELPQHRVRLHFAPTDFIQVNAQVNAALVDTVVEQLAPAGDERVLDLFSGLGNFSLPLARHAGEVIAVEGDATAVRRGQDNARANGLENVAFHCANLFEPQPNAHWLRDDIHRVLLDPPRSGARAILPQLAARRARRIVYVSCHPATLARDVGALVHEFGYTFSAFGVADMFPHTTHVESVAVLDS